MPTCELFAISPVLNIIFEHYKKTNTVTLGAENIPYRKLNKPFRILDVGCGNGKYGQLCREYLDGCWFGRRYEDPSTWICKIIAVEPFERYISPAHEYHYDHIINVPIEQMVKDHYYDIESEHFDIILLSDIIEHVGKEEGIKLLVDLKRWLKPNGIIIISTPTWFFHQGTVDGCTWEEHKCVWSEKEFRSLTDYNVNVMIVSNTIIATLGKKP